MLDTKLSVAPETYKYVYYYFTIVHKSCSASHQFVKAVLLIIFSMALFPRRRTLRDFMTMFVFYAR
jgi:hypothetical protein